MLITIWGTVHWENDPLYHHGEDRIRKTLRVSDLPATIHRWHGLGRTIDEVEETNPEFISRAAVGHQVAQHIMDNHPQIFR